MSASSASAIGTHLLSGTAVRPVLEGEQANVYGLGPEVATTTKYGRYYLRFLSEFGAAKRLKDTKSWPAWRWPSEDRLQYVA